MMSRFTLFVLMSCLAFAAPLHAVTMDVNEGTNIDTTIDMPVSNDLGVFAMAGNPPTFLMNVGAGLKASYFGGTPFASLDCPDLSGLAFAFGNFGVSPGDIFFVQDGTRYAKVLVNTVVDNSHINMTWEALGSCAVDPPPDSSFTFTTYDQIAWFTDTSTNTPSSWSWDFNGESSSTNQNPSYFFATAGSKTVSLTASNTSTGTTAMENVVLTQRPSTTATVGNGWDLDGDTTDDINLISPDGCGGNATFQMAGGATRAGLGQDYRNVGVPDIPASITGTGNFCTPEGVNGLFDGFFVNTSGGAVYKFWAPEVSSGSARLEFEELTGVLPPPPVTAWSWTSYDLIAFFTDESTDGPGTWDWDFGDGNISGAQNPSHFYGVAGTYNATLEASNLGGSGGVVPMMVTVGEQPSTNPAVNTQIDFDGDGTNDLGIIPHSGCSGINVDLSMLGGATYLKPGIDYRNIITPAPGAITGTGLFCSEEGVSGLFNPTIILTAAGSIIKFWTPEVDGGGMRMEFEALVLVVAPQPPTEVMGTPGDMTAFIDFTAPSDDGGSPVIDYTADCGAGSSTTVTTDAETIVVSGLTNGTTYTCTVRARNTAGQSDPSESVMVTPEAVADVGITKADSVDPVLAGSPLTYTVTVTNNGPDTAENVVVTDTLPAGVTLVSTSGCAEDPAAVPTCSLGTIAFPGSAMYTITVDVDSATLGTITNGASVVTSSTDNNAANDSTSESTLVNAEADLAVSKSASPDPVVAGEQLVYSITVDNNGPSDASDVVVTDNLPAGLNFISTSGCAEDPNGVANCSMGTIAAGASVQYTITAEVDSSVGAGAVINNTATVAASTTDPTPGNDSGTEPVGVIREVDIAVSSSESIDPVIAGSGMGNLVQTITVTNNGPSDASGVVIATGNVFPAGVSLDSGVASSGTWDAMSPGIWSIGQLVDGASATLTLTYTVDSSASPVMDVISFSASLDSVNEPDTEGDNDSTVVNTGIDREVDIEVTSTESIDPVVAGSGAGNLVYVVTVENLGPSDASGVAASAFVTFPAGVSIDSVSPSVGMATPGLPTTWTIGDLVSGASETLTFTITVDSTAIEALDAINLTASLAAVNENETNNANDSTSQATSIVNSADLEVIWSESNDPVLAGSGMGNLVYTLTVINNGPSNATGIDYDGTVSGPDGIVLDGVTGANGPDMPAGGGVIATFSGTNLSLAVGETIVRTITLTVGPSAPAGPDLIVAEAEVTAVNETDPNPGNNQVQELTSIERQIDLAISKTDDPDPVVAGLELNGLEYVVTVTNNGPSDGDAVVINDPEAQFPVGVVLESHVASAGVYDGTDWVVDLPFGATETLTMTVTVGPTTVPGADAISNTATVTGSGGDEIIILTENDSATETTTVLPTTATWTVSKDFLDDSGASITATLTCTSGEVTGPIQVSEGSPGELTVERFLMGPFGTTSCEVTESNLPPDYFQVSASADCEVAGFMHEDEYDCEFVNAPIQATFEVTKNFTDDNPAEVRVVIECNTGLPLMQEAMVSEFGNPFVQIDFIVRDFEIGTLDCEVFEEPVPEGYQQSYAASVRDDALYGDFGDDDDIGCYYTEIQSGTFGCDITNTLLPVEVIVNKEWIDEHPEFSNPTWAEITFSCNAPILDECSAADGTCGIEGRLDSVTTYIDPENPGQFQVLPHWDGSTVCSATEAFEPGVIQDTDDCAAIPLAPGLNGECTIINTRFYEGIPTLSQYGLALLALLMLGMGVVGFRRFT